MMSETLVRIRAMIASAKLKLKGISPPITTSDYSEEVEGAAVVVVGAGVVVGATESVL
jgi:hypothetical protein